GPRPRTHRPPVDELRRQGADPGGPARQGRPVGLLDLLLHQLPPRPRRAAPARGEVRQGTRHHRRPLPEVRVRTHGRGRRPGRGALPGRTPRPRRPRPHHLAGLHRPSLADTGRDRPRGLPRGDDVGRGPRRRADRDHRGRHLRAFGPGHPPLRGRPLCSAAGPGDDLVAAVWGEGHSAGLTAIVGGLISEHSAKGTLHSGDGPYVPPPAPETDLFYPGKTARLPSGHLLVADSVHHSLVEYDADGAAIIRRIGSGARGWVDGDFASAAFSEPGGITVLPDDLAEQVGYQLVVADTVNHTLRGIDLETETVTTIAGTGQQHMVGAVDNV